MRIRFAVAIFLSIVQLNFISAADITLDCLFKEEVKPFPGVEINFTTCDLQNDLKHNSIAKEAIGQHETIDATAVDLFKVIGKKIPLLPFGLDIVFANLAGISIDQTGLTFLDGATLKELTGLKYLSVTNTKLTAIIKDTFALNALLEYIDLSGNSIKYIDSAGFFGPTALNYLSLSSVSCAEAESLATTEAAVADLKTLLQTKCDTVLTLQTEYYNAINNYLTAQDSSDNCSTNTTCPNDCEAETADLKGQLDEKIVSLEECRNDTADINSEIIALKANITELENANSCEQPGDGTCKFKVMTGAYACVASGIIIKTATDQKVLWNGTHETGKNDESVLSLIIQAQTVTFLPTNIGETFKSLSTLIIKSSGLTTIKSDELKSLTNLKNLEITSNKIEKIEAGAFNGLTKLEVLDLTGNNIAALPSKVFASLSVLSTLKLSNNNLTKLRYDWIASGNKIAEFYLRNNKVNDVDKMFIWRLQKAQIIDLSATGCVHSLDKVADPTIKFMIFYTSIFKDC